MFCNTPELHQSVQEIGEFFLQINSLNYIAYIVTSTFSSLLQEPPVGLPVECIWHISKTLTVVV